MPIGSRETFDFGRGEAGAGDASRQVGRQPSAPQALSPAELAMEQAQGRGRKAKRGRRGRADGAVSQPAQDAGAQAPSASQPVPSAPPAQPGAVQPGAAALGTVQPAAAAPGASGGAASPGDAAALAASPSVAGSPLMAADRSRLRHRKLAVGIALIVLTCASLCFTMTTPGVISPVEVVQIFAARVVQLWQQAFDPANALTGAEEMAVHPTFYWTLTHAQITLVYVISGAMLALSGVLYQNVFRNPIAAPSMLGVSSGIQLGVAIVIMAFGTMAGYMLFQRYAICYAIVAAVLASLFALSKLMGGAGRPLNVTNMLVVGVILNQLIGVLVTYITWYCFDEEQYDIFISMTTMVQPAVDPISWAILLIGFAIAAVPVALLRFRMNALGFAPEEMKMFGVNATRLQVVALFCGTVIMVTAQLQVGLVAMITLVVPHISRAVFGSEFRKQLSGAMLIGAAVLVGCHILTYLIPYGGEIPVDVVVNLVLLPAFVWLIATQQRRWD